MPSPSRMQWQRRQRLAPETKRLALIALGRWGTVVINTRLRAYNKQRATLVQAPSKKVDLRLLKGSETGETWRCDTTGIELLQTHGHKAIAQALAGSTAAPSAGERQGDEEEDLDEAKKAAEKLFADSDE